MIFCLAGIVLSVLLCVGAVELPCAARDGDPGQGQICVCNSTYCDTTEPLIQLDKTQFHYFKTSNSSPGFTHSILEFSRELPTEYNDEEVLFTVDPTQQFQEYEGIGGSITDTVGMLFNGLSSETKEKFMKSYFGPSGLEYSFIRVPIGGTDFSERQYTLDDFPFDDDLSHFSLAAEDFTYRIPMIKSAMTLSSRQIKLVACTWSSPPWMKINHEDFAGFIMDKYQALWARYHVKFVKAYQENGLDVWGLSAGNEPFLLYLLPLQPGVLNCTLYSADGQAKWLKEHLKPQLVAANFSQVQFFGLEDQSMFLTYWMDAFAVDPDAYAAVDGMAIHWYSDWSTPESIYETRAELLHKNYPEKKMLYTEGSINFGFGPEAVVLGSWYRASGYIYRIFMLLNNWSVGFMDWNLMLNPEGGPTKTFGIDGPIIVNTTSDEFYKQPIFYAIGHFSKFIHPGSVKVKVNSNQNDTETQGTEDRINFADAIASKRVGAAPLPQPPVVIPQVVKSIATTNPDGSFSVIVLNMKNVTVPVRIDDARVGSIVLNIEENSINSFIYWP